MSNGQTPSDKPARNIAETEQDSKNMKTQLYVVDHGDNNYVIS